MVVLAPPLHHAPVPPRRPLAPIPSAPKKFTAGTRGRFPRDVHHGVVASVVRRAKYKSWPWCCICYASMRSNRTNLTEIYIVSEMWSQCSCNCTCNEWNGEKQWELMGYGHEGLYWIQGCRSQLRTDIVACLGVLYMYMDGTYVPIKGPGRGLCSRLHPHQKGFAESQILPSSILRNGLS